MVPLGLLSPGEKGEIVAFRGDHGCARNDCRCGGGGERGGVRLEDLGLRVGKVVEMLNGAGGPVLLRVDESRLAVGRSLAMKIMVAKAL